MALLSVVMADALWAADAATPSAAPLEPLATSRDDRLTAIVRAIDAFGVAVERNAMPDHLGEMLLGIREQLEIHSIYEQRLSGGDAATARAMRDAHAQLVREIDVRVGALRRGAENGLAAHGLLLLWLYHTAYAPPVGDALEDSSRDRDGVP